MSSCSPSLARWNLHGFTKLTPEPACRQHVFPHPAAMPCRHGHFSKDMPMVLSHFTSSAQKALQAMAAK